MTDCNCSYVHNSFSSWMRTFHTIYVSLINFNVVLPKYVPICWFSLAYVGFEHGFVDTHIWVDVWKAYHILIHIIRTQTLIEDRYMCILKGLNFSNLEQNLCPTSLIYAKKKFLYLSSMVEAHNHPTMVKTTDFRSNFWWPRPKLTPFC